MAETTTLGLYKPTIGETGWGDEMNSNLDSIDKVFRKVYGYGLHVGTTGKNDNFSGTSLNGKWSLYNLSSGDISTGYHLHIVVPSTVNKLYAIYQAAPTGDFSIITKVVASTATYDGNYDGGLVLMQGLTTSHQKYLLTCRPLDYQSCELHSVTDETSKTRIDGPWYFGQSVLLKFNRTGTTWNYYMSTNGDSWYRIYTVSQPFTPAYIGLGFLRLYNEIGYLDADFFEVIE